MIDNKPGKDNNERLDAVARYRERGASVSGGFNGWIGRKLSPIVVCFSFGP